MLTVKVMHQNGGEELHCGSSIGYHPEQRSITVSGMDGKIILKDGDIAYVLNQSAQIITIYKSENNPKGI
ncbi:hypothetical protein AAM31_004592 [Salmonella enterica subsp. enterica]|nr:hypothetical protein [Salmonella enterica subsp. enterica]EGW8417520.1 hypothetical protein [Salmonella enterica]